MEDNIFIIVIGVFVGLYIFMYKIIFLYLFDINPNRNLVESLPTKKQILLKKVFLGTGLIIVCGIFLFISGFFRYTPQVLASVYNLNNYIFNDHIKHYIEHLDNEYCAIIWFILVISLQISTGIRLKHSFSNKIRIYENTAIINLCGYEYSLFLVAQEFIAAICVGVIFLTICGFYNNTIQILWDCSMYFGSIVVLINGIFTHQRMVILDSGVVTYSKYAKQGVCKKEDINFIINESKVVKVMIKGEEMFSIPCISACKIKLIEGLTKLNAKVKCVKFRVNRHRKVSILKIMILIFIIIISGNVGYDKWITYNNQKQEIAKVADWFHAIDSKADHQKLRDIVVDEKDKSVYVNYKLSGTFEHSLALINEIRKASDQYMDSHKEDKLNKDCRITIIFSDSYRYSVIASLCNESLELDRKMQSSKLEILELNLRYLDSTDSTDFSEFQGIKGLLISSGQEISYLNVMKQFPDLRYLCTDYKLSEEEWKWCKNNQVSCKTIIQNSEMDNSYYRKLYHYIE